MAARGKLVERTWRRSDQTAATIDDISVTVIPVSAYKQEYAEWQVAVRERKERRSREASKEKGNNASAEENGDRR